MQRGEPDSVGATHPCLVVTEERWWLFYAGYDGQVNGRRSSILAAICPNGASWDRVGVVMAPEPGELAVSEPWVVIGQRHFSMFYVSDDEQETAIELATSDDGLAWDRRGTTLSPHDAGGCNVRLVCAEAPTTRCVSGTQHRVRCVPDRASSCGSPTCSARPSDPARPSPGNTRPATKVAP
jgi:predicted GH43/DUF377 family glycosyl hydrolase